MHGLSILETIQRAEKEAQELKRDAANKAQNTLRDAQASAADNKAARVKAALDDADKKLAAADEIAKNEAAKLRELRVSEHETDIMTARARLPKATDDILGRIVKAV